jgi:hypothetical protein
MKHHSTARQKSGHSVIRTNPGWPLDRRQFLQTSFWGLALAGAFPRSSHKTGGQNASSSNVDAALLHLAEQMDRYHKSFDVYTDFGSAGNHFLALAKIGDDLDAVDIDLCSRESLYSGFSAIKNSFRNTTGTNFGGWLFLNGVLTGEEHQPRLNFGDIANAGADLRDATRLTFRARGASGGEQIEFFIGGIGRDSFTGAPNKPFPDSTPRIPPAGTTVTLTSDWSLYTIDLTGADLSYLSGGFAWLASARKNPQGAVFWLDDIQFDKARLEEPRLILSYVTSANDAFDIVHRNVAFTQDSSILMLAFMARGSEDDWRRAKLIADALVYAQGHDRFYSDGRLRNAYQAGDLTLPPGWTPNGKTGVVRLPTITDCSGRPAFEDRFQVSSTTGNILWAVISLLTYFQRMGGSQYLDAARMLGEWIRRRQQTAGLGGFRGGFEGFDKPSAEFPNDPVEVPWANTEHNLAAFAGFTKLFQATNDSTWSELAAHARKFIDDLFDAPTGCFLSGTKNATTLDRDAVLLPPQALSLLALPDGVRTFSAVIECAEQHHKANQGGFTGFDYNDDRDGVWFEGTSYLILAYNKARQASKAAELIAQLRQAQNLARNANGKGIVAASKDGVTTGFFRGSNEPQLLFNRLHTSATAWYVFAESGVNPFYLFDSRTPSITACSIKGKKLFVCGDGFDEGAVILLNGEKQKTANDSENPTTLLIAKKSGKKVSLDDKLRVQNSDGTLSQEFTFSGSSSGCA